MVSKSLGTTEEGGSEGGSVTSIHTIPSRLGKMTDVSLYQNMCWFYCKWFDTNVN